MTTPPPPAGSGSAKQALVRVADVADIPDSGLLGARAEGVEFVVVRRAGQIRVFQGQCLHQSTLLAEGRIEENAIVCPAHGWRYDCATGRKIGSQQLCLKSFDATLDGGKIFVTGGELRAWRLQREAPLHAAGAEATRSLADLPGPRGLPLLGSALALDLTRLHLLLEGWARQFGPVYRFEVFRRPFLVVSDAALIRQVLRDRPDTYRRLASIERAGESIGLRGVFTAEGEAWRRQRRFVARALDGEHLQRFFPALAEVTGRLQRRWARAARDGARVDAQQDLMRYTVDVTTNLAFGYDMNTLEQGEDVIQRHLERIFPALHRRINSPFPYWRYFKLPSDRALDESLAVVGRSIGDFIQRARRRIAEASEPRVLRGSNFLEAMLLAQDDEEAPASDAEIAGNVFTMLLAGEDTTANTLAWAVHFMTLHPDVQARMQLEADTVLGANAVLSELRDAERLDYIEAVIHETSRLKPVTPLLFVEPVRDVVLGGVRVPAATPVLLCTRYACLEGEHFEAAAEFRPERWLSKAAPPPGRSAFIPFGFGPRVCPGRNLALLEMRSVLAMLCKNFEVRPAGQVPVADSFSFTLAPENLLIELTLRGDVTAG